MNGLIEQGGYINSQESSVQNHFPISFVSKPFSMSICSIRTSVANHSYDHVNSVTQNGFKCLVAHIPFYYFAIGF